MDAQNAHQKTLDFLVFGIVGSYNAITEYFWFNVYIREHLVSFWEGVNLQYFIY